MDVPGRKASNLEDSMLKGSAEDFDHKCDPCLTDDQHVEAHGFCLDCHEYLCKNCFKFHQRTKALKHHVLLDKDSMTKVGISTAVSTSEVFTERCSTHKNEVIKFYCPTHEALGCTDCITMDHRACKIDYIPDKCAGIGDSVEYRDILKKLDQTITVAHDVKKRAEVRDKEIDAQYENVTENIAKFRKEINDRLDQLQTKVNEMTNKRRSKDKHAVKMVLEKCINISSDVKTFQTSLQNSKSTNQNGQLYITIKQAKSELKSDALELIEQSLGEVNVQFEFERDIHGKVLNEIDLKKEGFEDKTCIAYSKNSDLIYISFSRSSNIIGVTSNGEISAAYQDSNLKGPQGIVVLDDGSLLVCTNSFHTIHRITGDLKECHTLDVDVKQTYSICYNNQQKKVYTGSFSNDLLKVFSLK
ncbi:E3 ubiquitin-protein ligase TRIM71-like [Mercenaria mercenaria]|uniref:E3 ubiquitin-protein ligase TRIM71-like n=1 Tax=Mercenaria mercenaria TaxID=6596 RepID=UPI00234EE0AF|nr:E3 ubiquitin-protein ligase TRIM71-like [Mercenaria mercenaria]